MENLVAKVVRAGGRSGMLGLVYVLPLVPLSCPAVAESAEGATVVAKQLSDNGVKYVEAAAASAAFSEFQSILHGYPNVFLESEVLSILKEKEVSRKQFEKDVVAYELKENEWGYVEREEDDYVRTVQDIKLLRRAMTEVSEKAETLHRALLSFAGKSIQTALDNKAVKQDESGDLTAADAEMAYREFSLSMVRLFARDLVAFRSHAQWLEGDVQSESPNRAPRSIAVSQYLSCNGNNSEIIMSADGARHLWSRQLAIVEGDLFSLPDGGTTYTDPISRAEWGASRAAAKKTVAVLKIEWDGVKAAYESYMKAWEDAFAPMPGYRGSGTPYWSTDMCMHMFSHWEELVSWLLFRNQTELSVVNKDCFMLRLPGKEANEFANQYYEKLSEAVKHQVRDKEDGEDEPEVVDFREQVARLYDARLRYAIAGISCEFYGDDARIAEETEKARHLIKEAMQQDIAAMFSSADAAAADTMHDVHSSRDGLELWRNQMRLMLTEIGKSYEDFAIPKPFGPAAVSFSETHVQRIQDLLKETDAAWNWYRRSWNVQLCCLNVAGNKELLLHALRDQWLKDLYRRAYSQESSEEEIEPEN